MTWALALLFLNPAMQAPPNPMAEATAHLDAGRYAQAIAILKPLAEKDPADLAAQFDLALAYTLNGQDEEAMAGFRKALALKDDLYEARLNLGQLLVKARRHAEAASWLEKAAAQKPEQAKPAFLLGRALAGQAKWTEAAAALEKACALDAANSDAQLELAQVYEQAGQVDKALALYGRLPNAAAVAEHRGMLLLQKGDNEGAIQSFESALSKSPTTALRYALATAYLRQKQPEKSLPLAAQVSAAEPANFDMRMFYGRLLRDQKRYPEAAHEFMASVKLKPDSGEAWNELTGMLLLAKQYEPALDALERARAFNGETPAYHYFKAIMLDALHQPKPALDSYRKFLSVSDGKFPDEEFKARYRAKTLQRMVER